ncbi:multicopper oxidase-domain-containing protein [Xylariaceae sp. FL0804]|nr:multicopper oxidase-domain-containing protein [Xylariaceae sp. FL0804]
MPSLTSLTGIVAGLLLSGFGASAPTAVDVLDVRQASTCNTPTNRACWSNGFNIHTDYEKSTPSGSLKTFHWTVDEIDNWMGPDGRVKEKVMLVNNQYPGPTLEANWGDTIQVTITNNLRTNGTSMHWHGIRQFHTNAQDGVNGLTECPLAPGHTKTYTFKAEQYGTSWYHSHFSAQYGNGVFGPIVIHGPASANYDIDLGAYPIGDYYLDTADDIVLATQMPPGGPPASSNVLFNGTNVNPSGAGGQYSQVTLTKGKKHLLRLINPSVEHNFQVSIVGHPMTVVETDFVPVEATAPVDTLFLGIGQRANVIIDATQPVGNYWMNVSLFSDGCGASDNPYPAAIVHYAGAAQGKKPTNPGPAVANLNCRDDLSYQPVVSRQAPSSEFSATPADTLDVVLNSTSTVRWLVNDSSMNVEWDKPVLQYVLDGNTSYPRSDNIISINTPNQWTFWVIENQSPISHPMHLHGHDFLVLGTSAAGAGGFTAADAGALAYANPTRRDVTMLPPTGWLVLAFAADNPGAWLMHCHIAWHVAGGLSVQFLEDAAAQPAQLSGADRQAFEQNCAAWDAYFPKKDPFPQGDSGI